MARDNNGILGGKITLKEFFAAVGILGAIAFTIFTYVKDSDVRLDAVAIQIDDLEENTKNNIIEIEKKNIEQEEEIQSIRAGIGFIKGQLSTLITQIDRLESQNERMIRSMKRRTKSNP